MLIRDIFAEDINRPINGVIKVDQDSIDIIEQEVREYVITKELKKHFVTFFESYCDAFNIPTADIGVWISGFFGRGKSHFLKMLSYILENKMVSGIATVERFKQKFEDNPEIFRLIEQSTRGKTETILFNIDIEGPINKDRTVVLRVFAKMFYKHLGFYGDNLKVAMLEQYIDQIGKTEEFRRVFEEKKGKPWAEMRKNFSFNGKAVISTLVKILDMSEEDAKIWFKSKSEDDFSIARLVDDIKSYINKQPADFRLLFMIDEVGQYVGTDRDMLLNLQSLIEKIGSECGGKVWVVCTGQEAIDEIIKVRADEFSRIQARFKTRLSLSSASVDEVIQKRILRKKIEVSNELEELYTDKNEFILRNLISFDSAILYLKGYSSAEEFAIDFPFIPYQFVLIQKVFAEIRKHGNSGKHLSGGERSMLSGFQDAAQKIQMQDQNALVPFFYFYDTVHSFLDSSIRLVIENCQKAADTNEFIEPQDVDLLKLLYLIRYVDDIPASIENIVILMVDDIRADKILLREQVRKSLDRLLSQNYIGRNGDIYNFLTDEEQDIQREIKNTVVDSADIVGRISEIIFADIYTSKKFHYGKYDFDFDKMVDEHVTGNATGGMTLKFLTFATDPTDKSELRLMGISKGQAIVVLPDSSYYENFETAMKIRKYIRRRNVSQLSITVQNIIRNHQTEAGNYEKKAAEQLRDAIVNSRFYVDGELIKTKSGDAKSKIDQALTYLVSHVYSELNLISQSVETEEDIINILTGVDNLDLGVANSGAVAKMEEFLKLQDKMKRPTSMDDIQSRYKAVPYGWREIDIAAVTARLIQQQKVTIKYGGVTIQPNNPKLPDMLRKKTEIGKTSISIRQIVAAIKMNNARRLLSDYFDLMNIPKDEDGLIKFIVEKFSAQKAEYEAINRRYDDGRKYPDRGKVQKAIKIISDILSQQRDNIALIDRLLSAEDDLMDSKEDMQSVEGFFKNQVQIFDAAVTFEEDMRNEYIHISKSQEINTALNDIRKITMTSDSTIYKKIPELNNLIAIAKNEYEKLLQIKRNEILEMIRQCMSAIHEAAKGDPSTRDLVTSSDNFYSKLKQDIEKQASIAVLSGMEQPILHQKDFVCNKIEVLLKPPSFKTVKPDIAKSKQPKVVKSYTRQFIFPTKLLESEEEIDNYVNSVRSQLKQYLKTCDGIQLR